MRKPSVIMLPDVNVLVALADSQHVHHARAEAWFNNVGVYGWATCAITESGLARILANPKYANGPTPVPDVVQWLVDQKQRYPSTYLFWSHLPSLTDPTLFNPKAIVGHQQITDMYLLGLCQHHGGTFVTLDQAVTTAAIVSPRTDLLQHI